MTSRDRFDWKTRARWLESESAFSDDALEIRGFQVMQRWEDEYMRRLAEVVTAGGGDVLEVGFGLGLSAGYIEASERIDTHVVIECHPDVVARAHELFRLSIARKRFVIINAFWEDIVPKLKDESFDGILFDTCPLDREVVFFHFFPFFREAYRLLKPGGAFTYFSDEATGFSSKHMKELKAAGFSRIRCDICEVSPPEQCRYWREKTIAVPIINK